MAHTTVFAVIIALGLTLTVGSAGKFINNILAEHHRKYVHSSRKSFKEWKKSLCLMKVIEIVKKYI